MKYLCLVILFVAGCSEHYDDKGRPKAGYNIQSNALDDIRDELHEINKTLKERK